MYTIKKDIESMATDYLVSTLDISPGEEFLKAIEQNVRETSSLEGGSYFSVSDVELACQRVIKDSLNRFLNEDY